MAEAPTVSRLDALATHVTTKIVAAKDPQLPYLGLEHLAQGSPAILGSAASSSSTSVNSVFEPGDVLFGKLRPNLRKCARPNFAGYCSTDLLVLRALPPADPGFVAQLFRSRQVFDVAVSTAMGTKMPRTSWAQIRAMDVWHPPSSEQRRIAEVLDTIDDVIRKTEELIAKLKQMKQGLLHDLLTRGVDDNGELRDPERHPEQFKDSPLGRIPKTWEVERLGAITRPRQWPTISQTQLTTSGFTVFGANGPIGFFSKFNHEHPTVAITCRGATCGNVHVTPPRCYITGNAMALDEPDAQRVDIDYLARSLEHRGVAECVTGSAQPQIIGSELRRVRLPLPPIHEQVRIVATLKGVGERIACEQRNAAKQHTLKAGLMEDLLTGRVRTTVLETAP